MLRLRRAVVEVAAPATAENTVESSSSSGDSNGTLYLIITIAVIVAVFCTGGVLLFITKHSDAPAADAAAKGAVFSNPAYDTGPATAAADSGDGYLDVSASGESAVNAGAGKGGQGVSAGKVAAAAPAFVVATLLFCSLATGASASHAEGNGNSTHPGCKYGGETWSEDVQFPCITRPDLPDKFAYLTRHNGPNGHGFGSKLGYCSDSSSKNPLSYRKRGEGLTMKLCQDTCVKLDDCVAIEWADWSDWFLPDKSAAGECYLNGNGLVSAKNAGALAG